MVARELGLTDPAVHYHFSSKQSLYAAVLSQPEYGAFPSDGQLPTHELVVERIMHMINWWVAHPELGVMILRGQLGNDEVARRYAADGEPKWDEQLAQPIQELMGARAVEVSDVLRDLMWGVYSDAILSFRERLKDVAHDEYFQRRTREIFRLALGAEK